MFITLYYFQKVHDDAHQQVHSDQRTFAACGRTKVVIHSQARMWIETLQPMHSQ